MNTEYRSKGHSKFLFRYHLILVCKYRLKIMSANNIAAGIKKLSKEIASRHDANIWDADSNIRRSVPIGSLIPHPIVTLVYMTIWMDYGYPCNGCSCQKFLTCSLWCLYNEIEKAYNTYIYTQSTTRKQDKLKDTRRHTHETMHGAVAYKQNNADTEELPMFEQDDDMIQENHDTEANDDMDPQDSDGKTPDMPISDIEGRDFIVVDGHRLRPNGIRQRFADMRSEIFDQPIRQVPVKHESDYTLHPESLSATDRYTLDTSCYDLDTPTSDTRIKNAFQYYTYLLSGIGHNISKLTGKKRKIQQTYNEVDLQYQRQYAYALDRYGRKSMGSSQEERSAWMRNRYPALCEIRDLCKGFLEEVDIEYDRLDVMQQVTSRCITGIENDTKMRGEYAWGNPQDKISR